MIKSDNQKRSEALISKICRAISDMLGFYSDCLVSKVGSIRSIQDNFARQSVGVDRDCMKLFVIHIGAI